MNRSEAGRLGGIETSVRYGSVKCPTCGRWPEKSKFHARNGRKGGQRAGKRALLLHKELTPEGKNKYFSELGRKGGRPRNDADNQM